LTPLQPDPQIKKSTFFGPKDIPVSGPVQFANFRKSVTSPVALCKYLRLFVYRRNGATVGCLLITAGFGKRIAVKNTKKTGFFPRKKTHMT